jgi:hypothetical protein
MKDYCCSKIFEPYYLDAMKNKKTASITTVIIAVAVIIFQYIDQNWSADSETNFTEFLTGQEKSLSNTPDEANHQLETLYANKQSDIVVETRGEVIKLLADDTEGSRHQKFIMQLSSGHTVLISHNIDLAPRINALKKYDTIKIKGEYEWSERGGVIHWTHHDPAGRHEDGWIEHQGKRYY